MKKIVVIDDDSAICESLKILLSSVANVEIFDCLETARKYIRKEYRNIDLLIIDYNVGEENGISFYKKEIIKNEIKLPAILISGFIVTQLKTPYELNKLDNLFLGVYEKPFDFIAFRKFVKNFLENS
jgi:DNA-binding NtrC family response regulator